MFKKEVKNNVIKYTLMEGSVFGDAIGGTAYEPQSYYEARFDGIDFTTVERCYCGNFKPLSGLVCRECKRWADFHK